ncbi:hypothetical protein MMC08_004152 [Hypocenomyce scalaris]|nr:hypothetical protein [Hypocenomyce scalaris]
MVYSKVPERLSSLAAAERALRERELTISRDSLAESIRSFELIDAEYWDVKRQVLGVDIDLLDLAREEAKDRHLECGGSLTDPAWGERERRFEQRRDALVGLVVSAHAEPGKLLEDRRRRVELSRPIDKLAEKAFVEVLLRSFQGLGPRDRTCQSEFRMELIRTYNSRHPEDDSVWCPVMHTFALDPDQRVAAHIFPRRLGQRAMNQIFGVGADGDLSGIRNGLIISSAIERKFAKFQLVIVPTKPRSEANPVDDWVLRVVDHQIDPYRVYETGLTFKEIDGRPLVFRSAARPAARYLYLHYVVAMLLTRTDRNPKSAVIATACKEVAWPTPGKYIRQNMLAALIREVGEVEPAETEAFQEHIIPDTDTASSKDLSRLCERLMNAFREEREEGEEGEEEDERDEA